MSEPNARPQRFPGFDAAGQSGHWDDVTTGVVLSRLSHPSSPRFFTPAEHASATALLGQLLDLSDAEHEVAVLALVDERLALGQTDGWHYADLPHDDQAWRETLRHLDDDAWLRAGTHLAQCSPADQAAVINAVQERIPGRWHGLPAKQVWSLWTRYACTAFYSHPWAWDEIGFPGPAYPRGYRNPGVGKLEPFEVPDAAPADPVPGRP